MKTILTFLTCLLCASGFGANPTFSSFTLPLAPSGSGSGQTIGLQYDTTLSLVSGKLHVVSSGSGTVTSVGYTGDGTLFNSTVSGSPVTTSGTFLPALLNQSPFSIFGNGTASTAAPAFTTNGTWVANSISSQSFTGNGSGLTSLNGSSVSSGTVADARLSGNVPLLNGMQTFTQTNAFKEPATETTNIVSFINSTGQKIVQIGTLAASDANGAIFLGPNTAGYAIRGDGNNTAVQAPNATGSLSLVVGNSTIENLVSAGISVTGTATASGGFASPFTYTASGTTGAQTINKPSGDIRIAAAGSSVVLTNSLITSNSRVFAQLCTSDTTAKSVSVSQGGSGSCTFTLNAAATAEVQITFLVWNDSQ